MSKEGAYRMHGKTFSLQGLLPGSGGISLPLSSGCIEGDAGWEGYWVYEKKLRCSSLSMQELFLSYDGDYGRALIQNLQ
jgi:hypothetical protein